MSSKGIPLKLTVDIIIFLVKDRSLHTLLAQRKYEPFQGGWALPGGFVEENEDLEAAAKRELFEETNVEDVFLEQLFTFGKPGRDPRGHTVTVAYYSILRKEPEIQAGTDAALAQWFPVKKLPPLAFDHKKILKFAVERLQKEVRGGAAAFQFLPKKFTLSQLRTVYEAILMKKIDKRKFRTKLKRLDILEPLDEYRKEGPNRPAQLHCLVPKKFTNLKDKRLIFAF